MGETSEALQKLFSAPGLIQYFAFRFQFLNVIPSHQIVLTEYALRSALLSVQFIIQWTGSTKSS